jgi:predicted Zn-dependent protease with MMP-like domain
MAGRDLEDILDDAYGAFFGGDIPAARRLLDEARQLDGKARDVLLLEVDLFEAEGSGEEAVAAVEEALNHHEGDLVLTYRYATLLLDIYDDVAEGRPLLEKVIERLEAGDIPVLSGGSGGAANDDEEDAVADFIVDVWLTLSDCRGADLDPRGALAAAEAAVKLSPDDPDARLALATSRYDLCELDEAEKALAQALDREPRLPDAYWLRGRILTARGDDAGADKAIDRACALDPERFAPPHRITEDDFVRVMEESLDELPETVSNYLGNVAIAVEDVPPLDRLLLSDPPLSPGSLGLYEGTPPSLAPGDDPWAHFPNQITLFRKNIELSARSEEDLHELIASTLLHEVGHYLGLDEDDLDERGLA